MTNQDYLIRFGAIQKELVTMRSTLEDANRAHSEVQLRTPEKRHLLEDILPKDDHDVIKKVIVDALRRNIILLEGQLEHLTREWLSCVELRRNEEVTA